MSKLTLVMSNVPKEIVPFLLYLEPVNEDAQPPPGGWGWTKVK